MHISRKYITFALTFNILFDMKTIFSLLTALLLPQLCVCAIANNDGINALRKLTKEIQKEVSKTVISKVEETIEDAIVNIQDTQQQNAKSSNAQPNNSTTSANMELPYTSPSSSNQTIKHFAYTVNYNLKWNLPNWVAYSLTKQETTGAYSRENTFYPDPQVKGDPVITKDYSNSGYDRGHMAPAADMKWSEKAMRESFYMTNICPQNQSLNRGDWNDLEELARDWAYKYNEVFIACGPIVTDPHHTIGQTRKIVVPSAFYKVFLRKKGSTWSCIGFVFPNQSGSRPLMTYVMSINEIEQMTGIDFFYHLPDEIEDSIENNDSFADWTI